MTLRATDAAGFSDLRSTFEGARLPLPPIPQKLAARVKRFDEWHWGTRNLDRMTMYMLYEYGPQAATPTRDYIAVSHGGHGVNSYILSYHLVIGALAAFVQSPWGGFYMNNDEAIEAMALQYARLEPLVARAAVLRSTWDRRRRLIVVDSPYRMVGFAAWVELGPDAPSLVGEAWREPRDDDVLDRALSMLTEANAEGGRWARGEQR
jgi:hypothetical protein